MAKETEQGPQSRSAIPEGEAVGYGKPPAANRFAKGTSGNPAGRPRRQRGAPPPLQPDLFSGRDLLIEEAWRPIAIREGEQMVTMPMLQAVIRSIGFSAAKGNRFAQRDFVKLVTSREEERQKAMLGVLRSAVTYKDEWEDIFRQHDKYGQPRPDPLPHPDDVLIDCDTGMVNIKGPRTLEERSRWLGMLDHLASTHLLLKAVDAGDPEAIEAASGESVDIEALRRRTDELKSLLPARWLGMLEERIATISRREGEEA